MPQFSKSVRVPYTTVQAYSLVSDIHAYPNFIRWITALRTSNERKGKDDQTVCDADVVVGFRGFVERFSTRVTVAPNERRVDAALIRGPFRRLEAHWKIDPRGDAMSDVSLVIDYEFRNMLIGMLARANHDMAVDKILGAFLAEADRRYGAAGKIE